MRFHRMLVGTTMIAAAWPVAGAQAADYGGGSAVDSLRRASRQYSLVGIRTAANGTARLWVRVSARCGTAGVTDSMRLSADGSFAFPALTRTRLANGVRRTARFRIAGRVDGATASGTATIRLTFRRNGRVTSRCRSGARAWHARAATAQATPAPPRPGGAYYGLTGQGVGRPFSFVLKVSPNGQRVRTATFDYRERCRRRSFEWDNVTPGARIGSDGTFHLRERFAIRYAEGTQRYRVSVDGRFTTSGVAGTLRVRSVLRARGSGRVLDRCDTGATTFAGVL